MRVALAQIASGTDPAFNLHQVELAAAAASQSGADLLVCPEATMCSFARPRVDVAEPLDGPWASAVRDLAARHNLTIAVGMFTPGTTGRVRNTLLVVGPDNEAHYDKLHLFDALGYVESEQIEAGAEVVATRVAGRTIGLSTCYDIRFPELYKELARQGSDVILVPASWAPGPGKVHQWRSLVIARALDSTSWVVAAGQAKPADDPVPGKPQPTGVGHSMIVSPLGEVLVELGAGPDFVVVDLDDDVVAQVRRSLPVLANSRFETQLRSPA